MCVCMRTVPGLVCVCMHSAIRMCMNVCAFVLCLFILFSRLLFTEESILQHELGRGQLAFKWHKRSKPTTAAAAPSAATSTSTDKSHPEQPASPKKDREDVKDGNTDSGSKAEAGPQASSGKAD